MLDQGIWLPPSQFEAAFISARPRRRRSAATIAAARAAFQAICADCEIRLARLRAHASSVTNRWLSLCIAQSVARPPATDSRPIRRQVAGDRHRATRCWPRGPAAAAGRSSPSTAPQSGPPKDRSSPRSLRSTAPASGPSARNAKHAGRRAPKGGRKNLTGLPVICSSVWLVRAVLRGSGSGARQVGMAQE